MNDVSLKDGGFEDLVVDYFTDKDESQLEKDDKHKQHLLSSKVFSERDFERIDKMNTVQVRFLISFLNFINLQEIKDYIKAKFFSLINSDMKQQHALFSLY